MEEQKQNIVDGAKQYAEYIISKIPQKDENGNVKYYFSGSLAMLLLNSATVVKSSYLDVDGKVVENGTEIVIPDKNKESLAKGVRPISIDVDVVAMDDEFFAHKASIYTLRQVKENCNLATALCPRWETFYGYYFDWLSGDREFKGHDVAEITLQDGVKVIIAEPISLALHKFADGIKCKQILERLAGMGGLTQQKLDEFEEKYNKDIRDFASIFNGVVSLYTKPNFKQAIEHALEICPDSSFAGVLTKNASERIKQFYYDAGKQIDDDCKNLFNEFINAIGKQNKAILDKLEHESHSL